jgi:N6-L-threonylcarbamoyladenine synthase
LEVGIEFAKNLSLQSGKPLYAINHVEGHLVSVLAKQNSKKSTDQDIKIKFPVLSIIVSGGHTQFVYFEEIGKYQILGETMDDAAGECLDKIGRMLNLGYPAGPVIEEFAKLGNKDAYQFPLPLTQTKDFNLSFSGLKTFARNLIAKLELEEPLSKQQIYDLSSSAQAGVFRHLTYKLEKVLEKFPVNEVWLGGGVAANITLRAEIRKTIGDFQKKQKLSGIPQKTKILFRAPYTKRLCMDNAAMIALTANFSISRGLNPANPKKLDRLPRHSIV